MLSLNADAIHAYIPAAAVRMAIKAMNGVATETAWLIENWNMGSANPLPPLSAKIKAAV